jgi:PAS domain S-box-containing protein
VAILDAAVGARAVLVELLLVGPLIAATGASPRQTAIVAVLALVISIPLGWASDAFGAAEHVTGVVAVAVGGLLAFVVARLRSARERTAARLAVQYGAARVMAETETLEEAAPRLLAAIGQPLDWDVGHFFEPTGPDALRSVAVWLAPGVDVPDFERATRETAMRRGVGLPGRVWESGRPAWLADVIADGNFPRAEAAERSGIRGGMAFPVKAGTEFLAVIEFFARDARAPDAEMIDLLEALGAQIGEFLEGLRAAAAVRESELRKSAVLDSALDAVITIDHEGCVMEFNAAAEAIFGRSTAEVIGQEMAVLLVPPSLRDRHRRALRRYVETGEAIVLGRRIELTAMRSDGSEFPVELAISRIGEHEPPMFTGVVRDISERRRAEEERDELLRLEQLARMDATQARDQLAAILRGVADAVTAQAPNGRLLFANDAAVSMLGYRSSEELLAAPLAEIMSRYDLYDEGGRPFPPEMLPGRRALLGEQGCESVIRFRVRETGEERWSAVKATPIFDGDSRVAMAINVIEDITAHKRAELASRFLSESSAVLAASLNPDELLKRTAELLVPELADWCAVDVRGPDGGIERVALTHADPALVEEAEHLARRYPQDPDAPAGVPNVLRTGEPELYPEIGEELLREGAVDEEHYRLLKAFGMRSAMVVPMIARGRTIGTLSFVSGPSGRRFDEQDVELARELGRRCATSIDNARLYTERAYIARTLQQSLLPAELPYIPGIEAAARFRPTGEGNDVGGDFYDLFETGGRGWTAVMGDVCGKGPDAAAVTALARYTLRAAAMRERLPSRSLRILNEALLRQRDDRRFCTVAYAYLELRGDGARLGVASGGHPLPLLLRPDRSVEPVGVPGTLLGVVPDPRLEDRTLTLSAGDALVFYTDGVIEDRGTGTALDEHRLAEIVSACAGQRAEEIAARVEDAAVRSQGGQPRDDIAVLVLRVVP